MCVYKLLCIGERPSICPFLKNNGNEAPKDFLLLKIHFNKKTLNIEMQRVFFHVPENMF